MEPDRPGTAVCSEPRRLVRTETCRLMCRQRGRQQDPTSKVQSRRGSQGRITPLVGGPITGDRMVPRPWQLNPRWSHVAGERQGILSAVTSTAADVYSSGLDFFSWVIARFPDDAWERPSPCTGWRALDILGHVGAATSFGIDLLEGRQPAWQPSPTPGDAVEGLPKHWWRELAARAQKAMSGIDLARTVDTPAGPRSIAEGLGFPAVDLYVHGWDMARTAGIDVEIPEPAIQFAHSLLDQIPDEQLRGPSTFAAEVEVAEGAPPTAMFIGWTGRDPAWVATG